MQRTFKYRLYPNRKPREILAVQLVSDREHVCTACGLIADRDHVAAQVILQRAGTQPLDVNEAKVIACVV